MPSLTEPHQFNRPIDPGGFCYLCGDALDDQPANTQHVVPKKLFHPCDRSPLLMLVAHEACNAAESMNDQDIGQLVGLLWRTPREIDRNADRLRKKVSMHQVQGSGQASGAIDGLPLRRIILRWVQGFHAAIYGAFLPEETHFVVQEPFPGGDQIGQAYAIQPWHAAFVAVIKKNRLAGRLDAVEYPSGQCSYHCIWEKTDDGRDMCVFALDLYGWSRLGDDHHYPRRSCGGSYLSARPAVATRAVGVEVPFSNVHPNDAFAP